MRDRNLFDNDDLFSFSFIVVIPNIPEKAPRILIKIDICVLGRDGQLHYVPLQLHITPVLFSKTPHQFQLQCVLLQPHTTSLLFSKILLQFRFNFYSSRILQN